METGGMVMIGLAVCCILLSVLGGVAFQLELITLPDWLGGTGEVAASPETAALPETATSPETSSSDASGSDTKKKNKKKNKKKKSSSSSKRNISSDLLNTDVVIYLGTCKKHSALLSVEDSATSASTGVSTWCRFSESAGAQSWRISPVAGSDTDVYIRNRKTGTLLTAGGGGVPHVTVAATMTTTAEKKRQMWTLRKLGNNAGYLIQSRAALDSAQAYKYLSSNGCTKPEWSYPSIYLWNQQTPRWGIMKAPSIDEAQGKLKSKTNWEFCK